MSRTQDFTETVVFGAGSIGSFLGARLSSVVPTILVGRGAHAAAMREAGLHLVGTLEEVVPVHVTELMPPIGATTLVVVAVKTTGLSQAADAIAAQAGRAATALTIQNGLAPDAALRSDLAARDREDVRVGRAITSAACNLVGPGIVEYWGGGLLFPASEEASALVALFARAGVPVETTDEFEREVWRKLAVNCVANPLSALLGTRNRGVITPELKGLREALVDEVRMCARARGVELPADLADSVDAALAASENRNSMLQDIARARTTEIDHLNGRVAEMAAEDGRDAPVNRTLAALVRMRQSRSRIWA